MHNPRNGALQKVSSIHNKRQNHSMHSPAFAMKAQQNNCLNITLKFITCRNTRGFQYMQIQKHITLHRDRKSTRLNSSHVSTSYAVFCLKKKSNNKSTPDTPTHQHHRHHAD